MKLTYEQINSITWGADRVELIDGYFRFFRFTKEQELAYYKRKLDAYKKTSAAAGIKLVFKTDSKRLALGGFVDNYSTRKYYAIDVFANGQLIGSANNFEGKNIPDDYAEMKLAGGELYGSFELGDGEKTLTVYMPWGNRFFLSYVELDDGAELLPVRPNKRMLVFGDSITQGYDCMHPSAHHIVRLGEALSAEVKNKAIGGELFWPELVTAGENGEFDYIAVAYGTNDWSHGNREELLRNCEGFYRALSQKYPAARIFAIGPIWRGDHTAYKPYGAFSQLIEDIQNCVIGLPNVTFINGYDFVPHDPAYFADLRLHPNDSGFSHYFENLYAEIKKYI